MGTTVSILWPYSGSGPSFPYWNIVGPGGLTSTSQVIAWGHDQANVFWNQVWTQQWPGGYPGNTMFGAVSEGSGGWLTSASGSNWLEFNRLVVDAFLEKLATKNGQNSYSQSTTLGLYGSQVSEFQDLLQAGNWAASEPIVVWIAAIGSFDCAQAQAAYCPMPTIGGYFPMIWQYGQNPDHDITPYIVDPGI